MAQMLARFRNRHHAGRVLARALEVYARRPDVLVLGLPRGGVPVAYEVARELWAPLDVLLVRKLGAPGHEEVAMGAIAAGAQLIHRATVEALEVTPAELDAVIRTEERELDRRERAYRGRGPRPAIAGRTVILVDDGLATGASMRVAVAALRAEEPDRVVIAVPVCAPTSCTELAQEVDDLVCVLTPTSFNAVSTWYEDFTQVTDAEVRALLDRSAHEQAEHVHDPVPAAGP